MLVLVALLLLPAVGSAYEIETHAAISEAAAFGSTVNQVLRDNLGLSEGLTSRIRDQRLIDWITRGARREDDLPRFFNHFHNPLAADWSQAGLLGSVGQSSILWAQNAGESFPSWSWQDVRRHYFEALTNPPRADRDASLARAFEGLGRQIHLVQDAASPAHTRNDPHVLYNYESLVDHVRLKEAGVFGGWLVGAPDTPGAPGSGWLLQESNPLAPVLIARLIDTDRYLGANPSVTTEPLTGLAEYANGNFFSEDRIFTENHVDAQKRFPYPRRSSVTEADYVITLKSGETVTRRYFRKDVDGATGYRLAAVGVLRDYIQRFGLGGTGLQETATLDEEVYRDYAERLIPRAVSYSTALLDYFFRGEVSVSGDDRSLRFRNSSEETMEGMFALYYDDRDEVRHLVPGAAWTATLAPSGSIGDLRFSAPSNPLPKDPDRYLAVFRGKLGSERDAVVGKKAFIPTVITVRLVRRSDGTPYRGSAVRIIDIGTQQVLSSGTTDQDGRARLSWRPGSTALFTTEQFPMYWAGGSSFSSTIEGAKTLQATDADPQGELTVPIPMIFGQWPERLEACSGFPVFANIPFSFFQQSTLLEGGRLEWAGRIYWVNLITFIRSDTGAERALCNSTSQSCAGVEASFVADDINRVGGVVGHLVRDAASRHTRFVTDLDGVPLAPPICVTDYAEVEVLPVTIGER